jgi:hypothetical protein
MAKSSNKKAKDAPAEAKPARSARKSPKKSVAPPPETYEAGMEALHALYDPLPTLDEAEPFTGYWEEPDYLLTDLLAVIVNTAGIELGVTLFLKGSIISGTLISESAYLDSLKTLFQKRAEPFLRRLPKAQARRFRQALDFEALAEMPGVDDALDGGEIPPLRYLHLKDPMIIQGHNAIGFVESEIPILRIRTSLVDGWLLGEALMAGDVSVPEFVQNAVLH